MGVKLAHDLRHRGDRRASSPTTSARSRRPSRDDAAARGRVRDRRPLGGEAARLPRPAGHPAARHRPPRERPRHRVRELRARPARRRVRARDRPRRARRLRRERAARLPGRARGRRAAARCASSSSSTSPGPTRSCAASSCTARACEWASGSPRSRRSRRTSSSAIPDSGTPAAIGFARASGIPFNEGLIKNRYVGRTFIQPDQALREHGIKTKFNPLGEVAGKRVVVVDDSIVRGTTTRKIVSMLFEEGAEEVHVRVSSPPIVSPCFYGIDMATEERADRRQPLGRGRARPDRRDHARLPLARRAAGGDAAARGHVLPRLPHPQVPDRRSPTTARSPSTASSRRGCRCPLRLASPVAPVKGLGLHVAGGDLEWPRTASRATGGSSS